MERPEPPARPGQQGPMDLMAQRERPAILVSMVPPEPLAQRVRLEPPASMVMTALQERRVPPA